MSLHSNELTRLSEEGYAKLLQSSHPQSFLVAERQKAKKKNVGKSSMTF